MTGRWSSTEGGHNEYWGDHVRGAGEYCCSANFVRLSQGQFRVRVNFPLVKGTYRAGEMAESLFPIGQGL